MTMKAWELYFKLAQGKLIKEANGHKKRVKEINDNEQLSSRVITDYKGYLRLINREVYKFSETYDKICK